MEKEGVDKLPLTEASFCALEEAYERQWCQTRLVSEVQTSCTDLHIAAAASRAAEHLRRLWADTVRLHKRFIEVKENPDCSFTQEERVSLRLLGFRSPSPPRVSSEALWHSAPPTSSYVYTRGETDASRQTAELISLRKQCATLRHEGAQLLSMLAWYQLHEGHALGSNNGAGSSSLSGATCTSVYDTYAELAEMQRKYRSLLSPKAAEYSFTATDSVQRAEDVAIAELLLDCGFPHRVSVVRLGREGLFMIDRPVWISFASPHSATLMVRDPEGVEDDCTLESYLMAVYAPLLRAFRWQKPSTRARRAGSSATPTGSSVVCFPDVPVPHASLPVAGRRWRS
ncbi:hypothetical protein, unknown function [Leishmania tarentolae]|uniref:Uncharacterized protein n=1 Tax=Leishmania tarentolae TaxID=5689 RepID=A0A640KIJ0_LEITA|nr:hypothetical protein, unknown function [Leishmania tarentolae]